MYLFWTVKRKSHISWLFYCQRPDSASQNSLGKSLLANKSNTPIGWLFWLRERNAVSLNAAQHPETEVKDGHFLPESGQEMLWLPPAPTLFCMWDTRLATCAHATLASLQLPVVSTFQQVWPRSQFSMCNFSFCSSWSHTHGNISFRRRKQETVNRGLNMPLLEIDTGFFLFIVVFFSIYIFIWSENWYKMGLFIN